MPQEIANPGSTRPCRPFHMVTLHSLQGRQADADSEDDIDMAQPPPYSEQPPSYKNGGPQYSPARYGQAASEEPAEASGAEGHTLTDTEGIDPPPYSAAVAVGPTRPSSPFMVQMTSDPTRPSSPVMVQIVGDPTRPLLSPVFVVEGDAQSPRHQATPHSGLPLAIFTCLFCFWPLGMVAVAFAVMSIRSAANKDIASARKHARAACAFAVTSLIIGSIVMVVWYECRHQYQGHCGMK